MTTNSSQRLYCETKIFKKSYSLKAHLSFALASFPDEPKAQPKTTTTETDVEGFQG